MLFVRHLFLDKTPTPNELDQHYQSVYTPTHQQDDIQAAHPEYYRGHVDEFVRMIGKQKPMIYLADFGCSFPVLLEEAQKQGVERVAGHRPRSGVARYGATPRHSDDDAGRVLPQRPE